MKKSDELKMIANNLRNALIDCYATLHPQESDIQKVNEQINLLSEKMNVPPVSVFFLSAAVVSVKIKGNQTEGYKAFADIKTESTIRKFFRENIEYSMKTEKVTLEFKEGEHKPRQKKVETAEEKATNTAYGFAKRAAEKAFYENNPLDAEFTFPCKSEWAKENGALIAMLANVA